jgi:hypothetical protein
MLRVPTLAVVAAAGSIGFGAAPPDAEASPPFAAFTSVATPAPIEEAGWRRQWRRQGYGPVVVPDAGVAAETDVEIDVEAGAPAVIVLPPPRPASCGQYRYWNGERCVDARYNDPYLGPR